MSYLIPDGDLVDQIARARLVHLSTGSNPDWHQIQIVDPDGIARLAYNFASGAAARAEWERRQAIGLCRECGIPLDDHQHRAEEIVERQLCAGCLSWTDRLGERDDPTFVVIAGRCYGIRPEPAERGRGGHWLGHGGARFDICFRDGREVVSHNLWSHGEVPPWFRDRFPDNAEFRARESRPVGPFPGGGGFVGPGSADGRIEL